MIARASRRCEYCRIAEADAFLGCEIEHIISEKHGGLADLQDLAWACVYCNRHKGTDIAAISPRSRELTRLFNPRADQWEDHFALCGSTIKPISDIGEATVRLLQMNSAERLLERRALDSE